MAGLVPAIHVYGEKEDVDARDIGVRKHAVFRTAMRGHDEREEATLFGMARLWEPLTMHEDARERAFDGGTGTAGTTRAFPWRDRPSGSALTIRNPGDAYP